MVNPHKLTLTKGVYKLGEYQDMKLLLMNSPCLETTLFWISPTTYKKAPKCQRQGPYFGECDGIFI